MKKYIDNSRNIIPFW